MIAKSIEDVLIFPGCDPLCVAIDAIIAACKDSVAGTGTDICTTICPGRHTMVANVATNLHCFDTEATGVVQADKADASSRSFHIVDKFSPITWADGALEIDIPIFVA